MLLRTSRTAATAVKATRGSGVAALAVGEGGGDGGGGGWVRAAEEAEEVAAAAAEEEAAAVHERQR